MGPSGRPLKRVLLAKFFRAHLRSPQQLLYGVGKQVVGAFPVGAKVEMSVKKIQEANLYWQGALVPIQGGGAEGGSVYLAQPTTTPTNRPGHGGVDADAGSRTDAVDGRGGGGGESTGNGLPAAKFEAYVDFASLRRIDDARHVDHGNGFLAGHGDSSSMETRYAADGDPTYARTVSTTAAPHEGHVGAGDLDADLDAEDGDGSGSGPTLGSGLLDTPWVRAQDHGVQGAVLLPMYATRRTAPGLPSLSPHDQRGLVDAVLGAVRRWEWDATHANHEEDEHHLGRRRRGGGGGGGGDDDDDRSSTMVSPAHHRHHTAWDDFPELGRLAAEAYPGNYDHGHDDYGDYDDFDYDYDHDHDHDHDGGRFDRDDRAWRSRRRRRSRARPLTLTAAWAEVHQPSNPERLDEALRRIKLGEMARTMLHLRLRQSVAAALAWRSPSPRLHVTDESLRWVDTLLRDAIDFRPTECQVQEPDPPMIFLWGHFFFCLMLGVKGTTNHLQHPTA